MRVPYIIRPMQAGDVDGVSAAFAPLNKTRAQFERYWRENEEQRRVSLLALVHGQVVAYSNLVWQSDYPPFEAGDIPEINDMHVLDDYQRQGIASAFIHELERCAAAAGKGAIGIGFGLTPDYGNAQRLYPKLGYRPDGRGARPTPWGDVLYLTKALPSHPPLASAVPPAYPIRTARLILRPFEITDIDDVFAYHSLPEVVRYMYWQPRGRDEVEQVIHDRLRMTHLSDEGDRLQLAVVLDEDNRPTVIGEVVLMYRNAAHQQAELGFAFNPRYHGRGYATEAAEAALGVGFGTYGIHRIYGQCDARNGASARVMERLGMRREGHFIHNEIFKGEWGEELVYAMLRDEWLKRVS